MIESAVTTKGQTTLPRQVRDKLGLRPGDRVRYNPIRGRGTVSESAIGYGIRGLAGAPGPAFCLIEEMEQGIRRGALEGSR